MSLVPSAVESSPVAERSGDPAGSRTVWLILGLYLLGAVALTARLWIDPASRAQVGDPEDVDLFAWFMRYAATAVSHGHLPALFTTAMGAPRGINVMWNTSFLLPAVLLSPVTLLLGPQVSLTIVLTLGFAGSAASMFWVLGRWGAGVWPAAFGGAVYGFSSALVNSSIGHYHMQFAVLPPLIIDAALRIVTGRGRPVRTGAWLGLLTAAQVFIGEELLTLTAVAGLVLVVVVAVGRPRSVLRRVRGTALGLATAAVVALALSGYALWVQFHGPLSQQGSPWLTADFTSHPADLITPSGSLLLHTRASAAAAAGSSSLPEYLAYLGWPLLVVLAVAAVRYWRDPRVRAAAVTFVVLELFSLGGGAGVLMPWRWLQGLPILSQVLPDRFAIVAGGAAAAVLAFSLDLASTAAPKRSGWPRRIWPFAVAVLALAPMIPLPLQAGQASSVPAGWQSAFARLHLAANASVLVVPVPYSHQPEVLRWQADTGEPRSFIGGWFVGPNLQGRATVEYFGPYVYCTTAAEYLDDLWSGSATHTSGIPRSEISAALAYWRPAAIIAVTRPRSRLERVMTKLFGRPAFRAGSVLAWRR